MDDDVLEETKVGLIAILTLLPKKVRVGQLFLVLPK
jgi:hypothetical protein